LKIDLGTRQNATFALSVAVGPRSLECYLDGLSLIQACGVAGTQDPEHAALPDRSVAAAPRGTLEQKSSPRWSLVQ